MSTRFIILVLALVVSNSAISNEMELAYKSFYSHVRKLDDDQLDRLQFSFGLQHVDRGDLCKISAARISTQKKQIPISVNAEHRFNMPKERVLKLADAKVVLTLAEAADKCDMSVQLETKPSELKQQYTKQDLQALFDQYAAFFEDMGGFLSFMMPSVEGLVFQFAQGEYHTLANGLTITNGRLEISEQQISELNGLNLAIRPLRITALTHSL